MCRPQSCLMSCFPHIYLRDPLKLPLIIYLSRRRLRFWRYVQNNESLHWTSKARFKKKNRDCFQPKAPSRMERRDWQLSLARDRVGGNSVPFSSITWAQTGSQWYHQRSLGNFPEGLRLSCHKRSPPTGTMDLIDNSKLTQPTKRIIYTCCVLDLKCPQSPWARWVPIRKRKASYFCDTIL